MTTQTVEKLANVDQMAHVLELSKGDVCDILSADLSQLYVYTLLFCSVHEFSSHMQHIETRKHRKDWDWKSKSLSFRSNGW